MATSGDLEAIVTDTVMDQVPAEQLTVVQSLMEDGLTATVEGVATDAVLDTVGEDKLALATDLMDGDVLENAENLVAGKVLDKLDDANLSGAAEILASGDLDAISQNLVAGGVLGGGLSALTSKISSNALFGTAVSDSLVSLANGNF